jgi:hypothetical protein
MTFSFIQNPTGQAMTDSDLVTSALDQPMSRGSTFWDQTKGGVLESFGLGTAIRSLSVPEAVPPESGSAIVNTLSAVNRAIAPETIVRRIAGTVYDGSQSITEDQYKQSPSFRKDIPWQQGMTEERAAALAEQDDVKQVRAFYGQKRPVTAFFGNLAGQAVDPINYIPIAGEAVQAANVARFGRVTGKALTSALDAAANTAIAGLSTASERGQLGDDVSWQSTVSQIAMAAMIGGAFGAIHGRFGRSTPAELRAEAEAKLATLDNVQASRVSLNDALDGMIRDSEVNLSPASSEFVAKAADQELPKLIDRRQSAEAADALKVDNLNRLSEAEHDALDAVIESEIRVASPLSREQQSIIDRSYDDGAGDLTADEISDLVTKGATPAPRDLIVYRGERNSDIPAREGEWLSTTFSHNTASIYDRSGKGPARYVIKQGTPIYSPRSNQMGHEILVRAADLNNGRDMVLPKDRAASVDTSASEPVVRAQEDTLPGASKSETVEVFHGTLSDFTQFDESFLGKETGSPDAAAGFFFSSDPYVANSYAIDNPYKDYKILDGKLGKVYARFNETILKLLRGRGLIRKGDVVRAKITFDNPRVIDAAGKEMADDVRATHLKEAKEAGHDAVLFKDMVDPGFVDSASANKPSDVFVVFDPSKVEIVTRHKSAEEANAWSSNRRASAEAEKAVSPRTGSPPAVDNSAPVTRAADQELPKVQGYRPEYELQRVEDGQAAISADQIDRVSRTVPDPGQAPKRPQTLFDFLASSGGIKEDAGELKSLGVSRKFVPGRGALVRKSGMALDKAREAAAQAGYFDHLYGSADEATAKSTVRDLLDLVDQEARGTPAYSMAESDRVQSLSDHAAAVERRDDYKKFVKDLSDTLNENKIGVSVDDAILARATDIMVEEKLSPLDAFDKAVLEDEARFEAFLSERGISYSNDPDYADIPFFDEPGPTSIEAGGIAGEAQRVGGPGGFEGNASDRRQPAGALGSSLQSVDRSVPTDPIDPTVAQAATRVGKPEATRALAEQYRVNPETGDFPELADIEQLRTEGRLTEDDLAALDDADEVIKTANAYGEALKSFASCVI